jgi:hypothetical protein
LPGIQRGLKALTGGKRGLASSRVLPEAYGVLELTWQSPSSYQSVFSWCRANMPKNVEWTLEAMEAMEAFNIHDPGQVPFAMVFWLQEPLSDLFVLHFRHFR